MESMLALAAAALGADGSSQPPRMARSLGLGESIQKAINAADPGDTIVVKGVHREDVVIRKDGIKLRGDGRRDRSAHQSQSRLALL